MTVTHLYTGRYRTQHLIAADGAGVEVEVCNIPGAFEDIWITRLGFTAGVLATSTLQALCTAGRIHDANFCNVVDCTEVDWAIIGNAILYTPANAEGQRVQIQVTKNVMYGENGDVGSTILTFTLAHSIMDSHHQP